LEKKAEREPFSQLKVGELHTVEQLAWLANGSGGAPASVRSVATTSPPPDENF
jgi:hypothetical protein